MNQQCLGVYMFIYVCIYICFLLNLYSFEHKICGFPNSDELFSNVCSDLSVCCFGIAVSAPNLPFQEMSFLTDTKPEIRGAWTQLFHNCEKRFFVVFIFFFPLKRSDSFLHVLYIFPHFSGILLLAQIIDYAQ